MQKEEEQPGVIKESIIDKISISDYLRRFLHDLSILEKNRVEIKTEFDAMRIKGLMDVPKNTTFKSINDLRTEQPYWKEQEVDYIPSNLGAGKGFIFYFLCWSCKRRTKHLYFHTYMEPPTCRICQRIPYRRPKQRTSRGWL